MRKTLGTAIDAFEKGGMTESEATVYVYRKLAGFDRHETAERLEKSPSTIDTQYQRAKKKAALPHISKIDADWGECITLWFENDAQLRYRWDGEGIVEETFLANDPHSVYDSVGLGGEQDELSEFTLAAIEQYINTFRDDPEACRKDWTPVYEAITLFK